MKKRIAGFRLFFGDISKRTRIMALVALVLFITAITLNGEWGEVLDSLLTFVVVAAVIAVFILILLGLTKIVGEKAAGFITAILMLGALGGCVGYVVSNWGY